MKKLFTTLLVLVAFTINAQKTAYNDFYKDHKEDSQFSMSVPVSLTNFLSDEDTEEIDVLLKKAEHCKVTIFNNEGNSVEKSFRKFARRNGLTTLVKVKDGKDRAAIYFKEKGDLIKEIIVKANSDEENLVMVGLKVSLTQDEFADIVSSLKDKKASR
ncbi:DUF4252 domain-containing protein [Tenacibaculum sp. 190524A05c]|uniref:DUF4252 domain-containing protein n=1 Tax=Tenacibaculum platacis TaxID=3137852 RepID=UPI0032B29828